MFLHVFRILEQHRMSERYQEVLAKINGASQRFQIDYSADSPIW